jgi:hypothetical protein
MTKLNEAEQKEEHLKIIIDSLKKAAAKFGKKEILIPRDYLAIKISDFIQISVAQANNYLKILDSRDIIHFEHEK